MNIIKRGKNLCLVGIAVSLITVLSSIGAPGSSIGLYCILGAISLAFAVATLFRLRGAKDEYDQGVILVFVGWMFLSLGIAFELLAMAPFYRAPVVNVSIAMASQGILAISGLYIILATCKTLKIPYAP